MDGDSPWEDDPRVDHIPQAEWSKITSEFTNIGYREGIIAGKEGFLQAGFDAGFAEVGVPIGRELGVLRGTAAAIMSFLSAQKPGSPELEELSNISLMLSMIQFCDIAPPDREAERHAKEAHLDDDLTAVEKNCDTESGERGQRKTTRSMEDVEKLKERLNVLNSRFGLPQLP